jgi:hypothetical protein
MVMKVELEVYINDVEHTLGAEMIDYGVVNRFTCPTGDLDGDFEVIEGPEFAGIVITDLDGNQWNPRGEELETMDDILRDWWYVEVEEVRI